MIAVIYDILYRNQCNFVIEVTWSIMRNMTDNAPNNSERFLNEYGLQYFSLCWKVDIFILKYTLIIIDNVVHLENTA